MKVYVQDHGWRGVIIVTAFNMEQASEKMANGGYYNYDKDVEIEEFELQDFEYCNLGDC